MSIDEFFTDFKRDIQEIRECRRKTLRARKKYKMRFNPLNMPDDTFRQYYRFTKQNMLKIVDLLRNDLEVDLRGGGVPVELQVMAVIRYWARHGIQENCADVHGISQQTLSRLAQKVSIALCCKSSQYIKMPENSTEESTIMHQFEEISGMKNITGVLDCTHIKIQKISDNNGQSFINSQGQYSINTQVICDATLRIRDIVCRWRGSTDDARIYNESSIKRRFEENDFFGKLMGDCAYPCSFHLLTPVLRPITEAEERYNQSFFETHNVVQQCMNVWKERFRILQDVIRGSLNTAKTTVVACAVLHNIAMQLNEPILEDTGLMESEFAMVEEPNLFVDDVNEIHRNQYIEEYFST
ncbi:unnamed protein product [Pieris brassicae]|uniref:Putative nuclease HARBI1 n=1 Tax=Pieris brassicae TaxID=7116 RepID=A0A9P0X2Q7_PIEBR|nr:unnamed protein product [Pieris brassicae]